LGLGSCWEYLAAGILIGPAFWAGGVQENKILQAFRRIGVVIDAVLIG